MKEVLSGPVRDILVMMVFLARVGKVGEGYSSVGTIARETEIPASRIQRAIAQLKPLKVLAAKSGANGGYRLAVHPDSIQVTDLLRCNGKMCVADVILRDYIGRPSLSDFVQSWKEWERLRKAFQ